MTRIVLYGRVVFECFNYVSDNGGISYSTNSEILCCVLLTILFFLQVYWMYLIIAVAIKQQSGGNASDTRSDSECSDDEDDEDAESYAWNEDDDKVDVAPQDTKKSK